MRVEVQAREADQRFRVAAENIDPLPWRWWVYDGDNQRPEASGDASFLLTARMRAHWAKRRAERQKRRRERFARRAAEWNARD